MITESAFMFVITPEISTSGHANALSVITTRPPAGGASTVTRRRLTDRQPVPAFPDGHSASELRFRTDGGLRDRIDQVDM
jgi:hypothetical protein